MAETPPLPPVNFYSGQYVDPEESVGYLMRRVMSSIRTQIDAELVAHDVTYVQWMPLFKLSLCTDATVAGLARDLDTDPAAMTRALDRLESKGLVRRERSTHDRRVVHVQLTDEGRQAAAQVPPMLARVLNGHLAGFSTEEWQTLLALLRRMLQNGDALRQQSAPETPGSAPSAAPSVAPPE